MKFPPTFSSSKNKIVRMTIYNDDGTVLRHQIINRNHPYAIMYFKLMKTSNYNTYQILNTWNEWWNNGKLDGFKYDLIGVIYL